MDQSESWIVTRRHAKPRTPGTECNGVMGARVWVRKREEVGMFFCARVKKDFLEMIFSSFLSCFLLIKKLL